jgi:hypothetical protein
MTADSLRRKKINQIKSKNFYRNPEGLNVKRLNLPKISESRTGGGYLSIDPQR